MYSIYFMKSERNGKIYVGLTTKDPRQRVKEHNQHSNHWSRKNSPFSLKYFENYYCEKDAKLRELFYKSGFGKQIKYLILEILEKKGVKP